MEISSQIERGVTVVSITGSIDGFTASEVLQVLESEIQAGIRNLVVELGGVDFISSAGLRAVLMAQKQMREQGGDVRLAGSRPNVFRTFKISGYTSIFKMFADTQAAIASFTD